MENLITLDWNLALGGLLVAFMVDLHALNDFVRTDTDTSKGFKDKFARLKKRIYAWFIAYDVSVAIKRYALGLLPALGGAVGETIRQLVVTL